MDVKNTVVSGRISDTLDAQLDAHCRANAVPRSYIVERALREYLEYPGAHGAVRAMRNEAAEKLVAEFAGDDARWKAARHVELWHRVDALSEGAELALEIAARAAVVCARGDCWPAIN